MLIPNVAIREEPAVISCCHSSAILSPVLNLKVFFMYSNLQAYHIKKCQHLEHVNSLKKKSLVYLLYHLAVCNTP